MFSWTFSDTHAGKIDYAVAYLDGQPVAGLAHREMPSGEEHHPGWLTYLAVQDVDTAMQTALTHGAKLLKEPRSYPHRGRQAVLADPDGAVFAILASDSGDPPDVLAEPGQWIWSSLHVQNADTEAAFYQTVFGYEVYDLASDDGAEHAILSSDNYARASLNGFPKDSEHRHPHWLNFVRVTDVDSMAAKAVALGGKVLVEPRVDRHGGKLAVITDPTGAPIGLMEWTDTDMKQVQP
jgi:predicted enzyme related to lactoylglutathione lyase